MHVAFYFCLTLHRQILAKPCMWLQAGPVIDAGGLFDYARQQGMIKTA